MPKIQLKMRKNRAPEVIMSDYQTLKISNQFEIEVVEIPRKIKLSDHELAAIEEIWQEELVKRPLFNGQFLSALSYDKKKLTAMFLPYKLFIAQLRSAALKSLLEIIPVGISGLTFLEDSVVLGKRSNFVTQFPGCYELAPSGGIGIEALIDGKIDIRGQLSEELYEEIGVDAKKIKNIKLIGLAYDTKLNLLDLIAEIKIQPYGLQTLSGEYSQIMTIPRLELPSFVKRYKENFVPLSLHILQLKHLL